MKDFLLYKNPKCEYSSISFNRVLNYTWERHSISQCFEYECDISSYTGMLLYKFLVGTLNHHSWFYNPVWFCPALCGIKS